MSSISSPRVSVIIPTYNRASVLHHALESALNQSLRDIEVIVVDDGSTDTTSDLIAGIEDPRVIYIRFDENRMAAAARNAGMKRAAGEYIAFLDSDDDWQPTKLEKQTALLDGLSGDWGCSYGGACVNKVGGLTKRRMFRPRKSGYLVKELLMGKLVIWTPTFMFRRKCLEQVGLMDESLPRNEDVDFYIRFLEKFKMVALSEPLVNINLIINKDIADDAAQSRTLLLTKHHDLIESLGRYPASYVYALGDFVLAESYFVNGRVDEAVGLIGQAMRRNPFMPVRRYLAVGRHLINMLVSKGSGTVAD